MRPLTRLLVPLAAATTIVVLVLLLAPAGAVGQARQGRSQARPRAVAVGRDLVVSSPVKGDVELFGGTAVIDSIVEGSVVVFAGNVELTPRASVTGDVICIGGTVTVAPASRVQGRVHGPGSVSGAIYLAGRGGQAMLVDPRKFTLLGAAVSLSLLLVWLAVAVLIVLTSGRDVRLSSGELRIGPLRTFTIGLVAFTSFVLTAIVFSYLVPYLVGIPLLAALALVALAAKVYGMVAVFHAVGSFLFAPRSREAVEGRRWLRGDLAMVVAGWLILGGIRLIPLVGTLVWMGASILGVGVALATRFGRREPWFLEWRVATEPS